MSRPSTTALRAVLGEAGIPALAIRPWFFPSPADYTRRLERHGFKVVTIELIPRPTPLPTGMAGWLETFGDPFLRHAPEAARADLLQRTVALLEPALCDAEGNWTADYVRLRFRAELSPGAATKKTQPLVDFLYRILIPLIARGSSAGQSGKAPYWIERAPE